MNEERHRILEMLSQGKIDVSDAERLLNAIGDTSTTATEDTKERTAKPKYLRVLVEDKDERVNIRVPFQLMRAGIKMAALIPKDAQEKVNAALGEKGIHVDLGDINPESLDQFIEGMGELDVNVADGDHAKVRVFCE